MAELDLTAIKELAARKVPAGIKPENYACTSLMWGEVLALVAEVEKLRGLNRTLDAALMAATAPNSTARAAGVSDD